MNRIHDSLRHVFQRHRLVFWYDPEGQWTPEFETFDESGIHKKRIEGTEFGAKVAIHRDPDSQARYLLYFPSARPRDADNWLLDLLLQGHEYQRPTALRWRSRKSDCPTNSCRWWRSTSPFSTPPSGRRRFRNCWRRTKTPPGSG
jgi:hypothetical protein